MSRVPLVADAVEGGLRGARRSLASESREGPRYGDWFRGWRVRVRARVGRAGEGASRTGRFVEEEDRRAVEEREPNVDPLGLATGDAALQHVTDDRVRALFEAERGNDLLDAG